MAERSSAENEALIRDFFAAWDDGDSEGIGSLFADDFARTITDWTGEEVAVEPDEVYDWIADWLDVIAETNHEIRELVVQDDQVMAHVTYRGIHQGAVLGVEPSGNEVEVDEYVSFRIENGEIAEYDWLGDDLGLLRQMGVEFSLGE